MSKHDRQLHYVAAPVLARLYELAPHEWYRAPVEGHQFRGRCLHPRYHGDYGRPRG